MILNVILQDIKKIDAEALIVGFHNDVRPLKGLAGELDWLLCGSLSGLIIQNKLTGTLGDVALLTSRGKIPAQKIFMIGLGSRKDFSSASVRSAARAAASSALGAGIRKATLECFQVSGLSYDAVVSALRDGLLDGAAGRPFDVSLIAPDADAFEKCSLLLKE